MRSFTLIALGAGTLAVAGGLFGLNHHFASADCGDCRVDGMNVLDQETFEPRFAQLGGATLNEPGVAVCFAPGTSDEEVKRFMETLYVRMKNAGTPVGPKFFISNRWTGTFGTARALTYSFVPDGLVIERPQNQPTKNSTLFATLDSQFAQSGGRSRWIPLFAEVFNRWSQVSGLTYTRIQGNAANPDADDGADWGSFGSATRGDVRISMINIDGTNSVLAYNYFPSASNGIGGDMVIDSSENWGGSTTNNFRRLRNVISHEHGHGMGINHVCPSNQSKLMEPFLTTAFDGPRHDDIRAAQYMYGDPFGDLSTAALALDLGTRPLGSILNNTATIPPPNTGQTDSNTTRLSLNRTGVPDWFRFTVEGPRRIDISLSPVGRTYLNGPQQSGSCTAGTDYNSLAIANLNVELIGPNGTTVLASGNANGAGQGETISNITVPTAGTYFIRVSTPTTLTDAQMYQFSLTVGNPNFAAPVANNDSYSVGEGQTLNVNAPGVLGNDTDADAGTVLTAALVDVPSKGTLTLNSNGSFTYIPFAGAGGTDTFTYRATDSGFTSNLATVTITIDPSVKTFSGNATLQNYVGSYTAPQFTLQFRTPGTNTVVGTATLNLQVSGDFTVQTAIAPGTYDVTLQGRTFLRRRIANVNVTGTGATGLAFTLTNGDVNGNNVVDSADLLQVRQSFGSTPGTPTWNANADLNGDNVVNSTDLLIVRTNFGLTGQ